LGTLAFPAWAENISGVVNGVTRDSASGVPISGVQIVAHSLDGGSDRATVSNNEGAFTFANVEPGRYEIAGAKSGYRKISTNVEVAASRSLTVELPLLSATTTAAKNERPPLTDRELELLERIDRLEARLAAVEGKGITRQQAAEATEIAEQRPMEPSSSDRIAAPPVSTVEAATPNPEQQIGGKAPAPQPAPPVAPPEHL